MEKNQRYINNLKKKIEQYDHEYYVLGKPSISDTEYDRLSNELEKLETSSIKIGSDRDKNSPLQEYPHSVPMLSLDKVYNITDLQKWLEKTPSTRFSIEPKIDGVSVSLEYNHGKLLRALTRGDGAKGSDITHNILTIPTVPKTINTKENLYIRGEVYMTKEDFSYFKDMSETDYANPRNLTAGVLRRLDSQEVSKVPLSIFLYQAINKQNPFTTHEESFHLLSQEGFPLPPFIHFFNQEENITLYINEMVESRKNLPFEIDGLVIKVNDTSLQQKMGETNHHPRWAMAFKFESPTGIATIKDILIQVGRTGKITPLAILSPVLINGSTVRKATLHNREYIQALEIGIGDIVSVSKRGEIIPAIEEVLDKKGPIWLLPETCPSCQTLLEQKGAHLFCVNILCPDRVKTGLLYFAKQLELEGFGESLIQTFYQHFNLKNPQDLWTIDLQALMNLEGFGEKKITNLQKSLHKAITETSFKKLLIALGIPELSENAIQIIIMAGYNSLEKITQCKLENIIQLKGIGDKTAQRIIDVFQPESTTCKNLLALESLGFSLIQKNEISIENLPLHNTTWVLTGTFIKYQPREKASEIIIKLGGKIGKSITKEATHLLYGDNAGSKLNKAKNSPNILLVNEKEFIEKFEPLTKIKSQEFSENLFS